MFGLALIFTFSWACFVFWCRQLTQQQLIGGEGVFYPSAPIILQIQPTQFRFIVSEDPTAEENLLLWKAGGFSEGPIMTLLGHQSSSLTRPAGVLTGRDLIGWVRRPALSRDAPPRPSGGGS